MRGGSAIYVASQLDGMTDKMNLSELLMRQGI